MLYWKRRIFRALLPGALFLGVLPFVKADNSDRAQQENTRRTLQFHHEVFWRDTRSMPDAFLQPPGGKDLWLQPTNFTPYDRYMGGVRSVINHLAPRAASMALACKLMEEGRGFHYVPGDPYFANPPGVTETVRAGDCKAKALWLYQGLGDPNALYVIGKASRRSRTSHAWVYWRSENRWWILDCTNRSEPIAAESVPEDRYIPYYSFGRNGAYRHKATSLMITPAGGAPIVADQGGNPRSR